VTWILLGVISGGCAALLLALLYWYLVALERHRYMRLWAAAWTVYLVRFVAISAGFLWSPAGFLRITGLLALIGSTWLMISGAFELAGKRVPRIVTVAALAAAAWSITLPLTRLAAPFHALPIYILCGIAFIHIGVFYMRRRSAALSGMGLVGIVFLLWGSHRVLYPTLRMVFHTVDYGLVVSAALGLLLAFGTAIIYYQQARLHAVEAEHRTRMMIEHGSDLYFRYRLLPTQGFEYVSPSATRILGFTPEQLAADNALFFDHCNPEDLESLRTFAQSHVGEAILTMRWTHRDGRTVWLEQTLSQILDDSGACVAIEGVTRDMTTRVRDQRELLERERQYRELFHSLTDAVIISDGNGRILEANKAAQETIGYTEDQFPFVDPDALAEKFNSQFSAEQVRLRVKETGIALFESVVTLPDGGKRHAETRTTQIEYGRIPALLSVSRDITDRKIMEETLRTSLEEKEVLLREVHHRVKNNLQIISSLLRLQDQYMDQAKQGAVLANTQQRIRSLALIHEELYQSQSFARISMESYLDKIVRSLAKTFGSGTGVRLECSVCPAEFDIRHASPCGLIVNELVTNALKYAHPAKQHGSIMVNLEPAGSGYRLCVRDDGVGLPNEVDTAEPKTLGLLLVRSLTEQLGGTLTADGRHGTSVTVEFALS